MMFINKGCPQTSYLNYSDAGDTETKIIPPPLEELEILYNIASLGVMDRIEERADNIEEKDSKYIPFANRLRKYAGNYDDEKLMLFIMNYINGANEN